MELAARELWDSPPYRQQVAIAGRYNPATPAAFAFPLHWHDFIELLFLREGEATVILGQSAQSVATGDLLCINPNEPHSFQSVGAASFGVVQVKLELLTAGQRDPQGAARLFASRHLLPAHIPHQHPAAAGWRRTLQETLDEIAVGDEISTLRAIALTFGLISEIIRTLPADAPAAPPPSRIDLERLYRLQDFVRARFAEEITLHDAAEALAVSRPHLCRLVRQWTGHSFFDYVREFRLTRAQQLLRTTDCSITHIAGEVGYTSSTAFDRAFRHFTGATPRAYRDGVGRVLAPLG
jgi:AraC-like DNA-binding protein